MAKHKQNKGCSDCGVVTDSGLTQIATHAENGYYCGINENACAQKRIMLIGGHNPNNISFKAMVAERKKVKAVPV